MAEGYVKILSSILNSSIWAEPDDTVRTWLTLLAMADKDGYVGAAPSGIAHQTRTVSVARVKELLEKFQQPDPESRTPDNEGRRLLKVDRGYLVLNYKKIRDMHGEESVKAAKRKWWDENRKRSPRTPEATDEASGSLDSSVLGDSSKNSSFGSVVVVGSASLESDARPEPSKIPCPPDLTLTEDQRGALETSMIPGWAIDDLIRQYVAVEVADQTKQMPIVSWRKCLAKMISGSWNDPKRRPKKRQVEPVEETSKGQPGQVQNADGLWFYPLPGKDKQPK